MQGTATQIVAQNPQLKSIDNWPSVCASISGLAHVQSIAPAIVDQAFASRGGKQVGLTIYGADPDKLSNVLAIRKYITQGHYLGLGSDEMVVNYKMLKELGVAMGDRIRITSNQNVSSSFLIVGIYDTGDDQERYVGYTTLRAAQNLYKTGTSVETILIKADDLFNADEVADQILAILPFKVDSWSRQNGQFLRSLTMMSASAFMISGLTLVAAAFAISSVLVVSVMQKGKEIGILKSMGATRNQIFRIFLLEGFGIAVLGALAGAGAGCGFVKILDLFKRPAIRPGLEIAQLFPSALSWSLVGLAMLSAVVTTLIAASLPARRAASLDPVVVMK